jgi:hypothetical protein
MGIIWWFLDLFRRMVGYILPLAGKAAGAPGLGKGIRWVLHILVVAAVLVGLYFLNLWLDIPIKYLASRPQFLQYGFLPILFVISYVMCWLGWWLWTLLVTEEEHAEFPDINEAWDESLAALERAGFELRDMPLFLVLGRTESGMEPLFQASKLQLQVKQVPPRSDAPLHVFASPEAVFVTCEGASLLGRQGAFLIGSSAGASASPGAVMFDEDDPLNKTNAPINAGGAVPELMAIRDRALKQGRALSAEEQRKMRSLLRKDQLQQSPIRKPEEVATQADRFEHLCRLIVRDRSPFVPINGVLVLLPFAATDSDQDALDTGATCQQDLEVLHRVLQVYTPTLALVTDLETAPGFTEFIQCFPDKQRHQRVGNRCPLIPDLGTWAGHGDDYQKARAGMLDGLAQWVCTSVVSGWVSKHFRMEAVGRDDATAVTQANAQLFLFMNELRERRRRLGRLLARGFALDNNVPLWFGGCYVAGTGPDPENQQGFVAGVFRRLIEEEKKGLVSWTEDSLAAEAGYQRWISLGQIGLAVFAVVVVAVVVVVVWSPWK